MATLKAYLDNRNVNKQGKAPLKISISHHGTSALLSLGLFIKPEEWDKNKRQIINSPRRQLYNSFLSKRLADMEAHLITQRLQGLPLGKTANDVKRLLEEAFCRPELGEEESRGEQAPTYTAYFLDTIERKRGKTQECYRHTLGRIQAFDPKADSLSFEDINKAWLERFGLWCEDQGVSINTIAIHYRNMRAVFNDAIDNERTTAYPFRRFKIKTQRTAKRSLTLEQLRMLFGADVDECERQYLDMFKLIFYLMGINLVDLLHLREVTAEGRVEFNRSKTKRFYSMKLEPEAWEIIERYRGTDFLLNVMDRYQNHSDYRRRLNKALQRMGGTTQGKQGRKAFAPLFPQLTTYWARHTWATIAASLDVPKETIAQALGHGTNSVTDIYIDFDRRKIDEANRLVIDHVLGIER